MNSHDNQDPFFETLSAYLDGQLSPNQADKVERRLADDPEARRMLDAIRSVSQQLGELPVERAPAYLADQVLRDIERDVLLSDSGQLTETAGRNHLFLRRMIAAAAMIMLTGSIGFIVYTVLFKSPGDFLRPKSETDEPIVAISKSPRTAAAPRPSATSASEETAGGIAAKSTLADRDKPSSALPLSDPSDAATVEYQCTAVELIMYAKNHTNGGSDIDRLLNDHGITQRICSMIDSEHHQYAFVCTTPQLKDIFSALTADSSHRIDLILSDSKSQSRLIVNDVRLDQLTALAGQADRDTQLAMALQERWGKLVSAKPAAVSSEADGSSSDEAVLSNWLSDIIAQTEPEIGELRVLGAANQPVGPLCTADSLKGHQSSSPTLSANTPGPFETITKPTEAVQKCDAETDPKSRSIASSLPEKPLLNASPAAGAVRYVAVILSVRIPASTAPLSIPQSPSLAPQNYSPSR